MKNLKYLLFLILFQNVNAQNLIDQWQNVYEKSVTEKVYFQLNNVLYLPGETVHFKLYLAESNNAPSRLSDYVYVDLIDGSNKKVATMTYLATSGCAVGSYAIPENSASGMYKLKAYTQIQNQTKENIFEKSFFIQKVVTPRILMTLDFKKKAYGKGEICEADFALKNLSGDAIKNYNFKYDVFIAGNKLETLTGKTDQNGKAIVHFRLPEDLKSNDGILNLMVDYDNFQESVTRSIPINLNFIDLQFLPESGNSVLEETSMMYFIAKNQLGFPMDVAGIIEDEDGNKVADFASIHDGMGKFSMTATGSKKYFAVVTSPFKSDEKIELPKVQKNVFVLNAQKRTDNVSLRIYAPLAIESTILVRNSAQIHKKIKLNLKKGWNTIDVKTPDFPVGIQSFSLVVENRIVAERLVFLNYQSGLKIEIKTDKNQYVPREKVQVSIVTKDKNNKPIASNLSVTVVDDKLLTYIDDKQHTILSWFLLGSEIKGTIYEPRFYFDENKTIQEREQAIDVLLNTAGWRKYNYRNVEKLQQEIKLVPEKGTLIEGFVLNNTGKPASVKVLLLTDKGNVFETKSNGSGYFKFSQIHFSDVACLIAESSAKSKNTIRNSFTHAAYVSRMKDTLTDFSTGYYDFEKIEVKNSVKENQAATERIAEDRGLMLEGDSDLSEVVVVGYNNNSRRKMTSSITTIRSEEISSLSGRVAGLQINAASGEPSASNKIAIRGMSSIYGNRSGGQPLIIVDGMPQSNNDNSAIFSNLSPNSIESIVVLKDAAATSIYGSAGAYGVIVVNTKSGFNNGNILLGKKYEYTFQYLNKSGTRRLNEPDDFYIPKYTSTIVEEKTDFRTCIYFNSMVQTNAKGEASFEFYNSDDSTTFKIIAEGLSYKGDLGKASANYAVKELIQTDIKVPLYASQEDKIMLPLWIKNNSEKAMEVTANVNFGGQSSNVDDLQITVAPNESKTVYITVIADKIGNHFPLQITLTGENYKSRITKSMDVFAKGFPVTVAISGSKSQVADFTISDAIPNSVSSGFKLFYNPFSSIFDGLESMMREPGGCFEQVSSSNYPNIMVMQLAAFKSISSEFKQKALKFLENGYQKLKNYESKDGGFEWYGGNPGHEALTAYGLLQFHEMKEYVNVDKKMMDRSMDWLNSRKDDKGGFKQNAGKYGFSGIKYEVNNAYIIYVLSEIGRKDIDLQYEKAVAEAFKSKDLYRMELMALASFNKNNMTAYQQFMKLIATEIEKQGITKLKAAQSVINSYGASMNVELASLYALALLKEKKVTKEITETLDFIQSCKNTYGFGSTQATALALKAITEFTKIAAVTNSNAVAKMKLNNTEINLTEKDNSGNVILTNVDAIREGKNNFSIDIPADSSIPYLFYVQYQTYLPNNSAQCKLQLRTKILADKVKVSEVARVQIEIENKSANQLSNPIARIGIPGGLTPEPWQLKELVENNKVDYYEIFENELVLYFRKIEAKETKSINIDFKAIVPGSYKGMASQAYLYYENEHKNWNKGIEIEVIP